MTDFLGYIVALVAALGVLIAVHEFGHFWVARKLGVKVVRFSIGFGQPLWRRQGKDGTEYVIAAIPLGGYVKMVDEREGEVEEAELPYAFNRKPVATRFAIVFAGPLFNFLFAIFAYWLMFVAGVPGMTPIVGEVIPGSLSERAGIEVGDQIVSVSDRKTPTWSAVYEALLPPMLLGEPVELTLKSQGREQSLQMPFHRSRTELAPSEIADELGMVPFQPIIEPVIGKIVPGSPAEAAGLQSGDRVVTVNGEAISDWMAMVATIKRHPEVAIDLKIVRNDKSLVIPVVPERVDSEEGPVGRIGASVEFNPQEFEQYRAIWQRSPLDALPEALNKTWDMSVLTIRMLGAMIVGQASLENLSGPISIAKYAKDSAVAGFSQFLKFLAIVSLSLGVLNLLPIPILDGGHLFFYLIEMIKGSPVSEQVEIVGQKIGIAVILMLMSVAIFNDIMRLGS